MALHFPLLVNGDRIGGFHAVRVAGWHNLNAPALYRVTLGFDGRDRTVEVEHSPADGAWVLMRKAIVEWEKTGTPTTGR
ncbi:hypothetical protein SEA_KUWABARA_44 [Gordonia phage Kuwabara]|nr:hypothetical protein SEA_KUWABARA_44 [Gordonia phage Kuwabara]